MSAAVAAPLVLLTAAPAQAASRDTTRFSVAAQGDAMFYEANSQNAPATPKNQVGSLTARAQNNSAGDSFGFAGAPYGGPTATTLPGTGAGLAGGLVGMEVPVPFTTVPGYVTSRFPSDPSAQDDKGGFRIKSASTEFSSSASGENGGPSQTMAPNQQQSASAKSEALPNGTVIATANSAVSGVTAGPLTGISAKTSAVIRETGNRKPVITSSTSGTFGIAGMTVAYDKKGFRLVGQDIPAAQGLAMINTALKNANIKLSAAPNATTIDKVSGATVHTIGGLQMTTVQSSPATEPATIDYIFARVQVSSVAVPEGSTGVTQPAVIKTSTPSGPAPSGGGDSGPAPVSAPAGEPVTESPVADEPVVADAPLSEEPAGDAAAPVLDGAAPPAGGDAAAAPVDETPAVLGAAVAQGAPIRSESSLLYLAIALAGLGTFLGSQLFSRYGVLLQLRELTGGRAA